MGTFDQDSISQSPDIIPISEPKGGKNGLKWPKMAKIGQKCPIFKLYLLLEVSQSVFLGSLDVFVWVGGKKIAFRFLRFWVIRLSEPVFENLEILKIFFQRARF